MEFYEDYVPLEKLYPYTFQRTRLSPPITPVMAAPTLSDVVITKFFTPLAGEAKAWKDLTVAHTEFMASASGMSTARKIRALENYCELWVWFLLSFTWFQY